MMRSLVTLLTSVAIVSASFDTNLNFGSPSLRHESLGIAIPKVVKRHISGTPQDPARLNFTHGVASGDPYPDSVILWTRISPTQDNDKSNVTVEGTAPLYGHETEPYVKVSKAPVCVTYKIGTDKDLKNVANSGTAYTSSDVDYTVKVSAHVAMDDGMGVRFADVPSS